MLCDEHDSQLGAVRLQRLSQIGSGLFSVGQQKVDWPGMRSDHLERSGPIVSFEDVVAFVLKTEAQGRRNRLFKFGNQNGWKIANVFCTSLFW